MRRAGYRVVKKMSGGHHAEPRVEQAIDICQLSVQGVGPLYAQESGHPLLAPPAPGKITVEVGRSSQHHQLPVRAGLELVEPPRL